MKTNQMEWEQTYKSSGSRHKNEYPSEVIVSWVRSNYAHLDKPKRSEIKCLDLGCGWGNNLFFLKNEGFDCYGIDFSESAINYLKPYFGDKVTCCSIVNLPYQDELFDFCIDRGAIMHNSSENICQIYEQIFRTLKKGGKLYSELIKEGGFDISFQTTRLTERELELALEKFSTTEINYSLRTKDHGTQRCVNYLIETLK